MGSISFMNEHIQVVDSCYGHLAYKALVVLVYARGPLYQIIFVTLAKLPTPVVVLCSVYEGAIVLLCGAYFFLLSGCFSRVKMFLVGLQAMGYLGFFVMCWKALYDSEETQRGVPSSIPLQTFGIVSILYVVMTSMLLSISGFILMIRNTYMGFWVGKTQKNYEGLDNVKYMKRIEQGERSQSEVRVWEMVGDPSSGIGREKLKYFMTAKNIIKTEKPGC